MKILIVTSEWPQFPGSQVGLHVVNQINYLQEAGLLVDVYHFLGHQNPFNYLRAICEFKKINLRPYDLIHAHHGQSGIVALSQRQRPVVVTFHGSDLQGIRDTRGMVTTLGYILQLTSQWVAKRANRIILVSQHLADYLPVQRPYKVIPIGIDLDLFQPFPADEARRALGLPEWGKLILFVGDPQRTEKRYWLAKSAIDACIKGGSSDAKLVVANNIPHERMPLYMNACDALLLTSSTEGSPTVIKEALACNLPIVSTDVGDVRTRLSNIDGCMVCSDDSITSIAQALANVLQTSRRIRGRESVLDLDERRLVRKVMAIYHEFLH
jgi:teichuronic acid biosynthesis glycosyltransferase TuaC